MTDGDEDEGAGFAVALREHHRRQLIAALEQSRPGTALWQQPVPEHLVNLLFRFLVESYDEKAARYWFIEQGRSREPRKIQEINNDSLLAGYDLLKEALGDKFKVMQFVRDRVEANKKFSRSEQRGAGGIDPVAFYQHLNSLLTEREAERERQRELLRQRWLQHLDISRRRLADVSAAFARASSKIIPPT